MKATIKIAMDNAAFVDAPPGVELAAILRDLAKHLERGDVDDRTLRDTNGNRVGTFTVSPANLRM
jgi:hypothetical protein